MIRLSLVFLLVLAVGCQSTPVSDQATSKQQAVSNDGMVATAHPLATSVARDVLNRGGNAADAAVAAGFRLAVAVPTIRPLGGRTHILVRKPDGSTRAITA